MVENRLPRRIIHAIAEHVRKREGQPVSVAKLTQASRHLIPDLPMSDEDLSSLIAAELMHAGVAIDADYRASDFPGGDASVRRDHGDDEIIRR